MARWKLLVLYPVILLGLMIAAVAYGLLIVMFPYNAHRVLVSVDQLLNTVALGDEDETISSRAAKASKEERAWGCVLCKVLDFFDPGHCDDNIEYDEGKKLKA